MGNIGRYRYIVNADNWSNTNYALCLCTAAQVEGRNAYNWLTGSQNTFASYSASLDSESSSSLLFTIGSTRKPSVMGAKGVKVKPVGAGFGKDRLTVQGRDDGDSGSKYKLCSLNEMKVL